MLGPERRVNDCGGRCQSCLDLLRCVRPELLATVEAMPETLLDWDPPYAAFASWARWRTIREVLARIALTEVGYYLPAVGYGGLDPRRLSGLPWREQLAISRDQTDAFLSERAGPEDLLRLTESDEGWTVRKVLRRLVWHELLHLKSIRRIGRDYSKGNEAAD